MNSTDVFVMGMWVISGVLAVVGLVTGGILLASQTGILNLG